MCGVVSEDYAVRMEWLLGDNDDVSVSRIRLSICLKANALILKYCEHSVVQLFHAAGFGELGCNT